MDKITVLARVTVCIILYFRKSCATCSEGNDEVVSGERGNNASISCIPPSRCDFVLWKKDTNTGKITPSQAETNHVSRGGLPVSLKAVVSDTSTDIEPGPAVNNINKITMSDFGAYNCWCYKNMTQSGDVPICTVTLAPICRYTVMANRRRIFHSNNSSEQSSSVSKVLEVTENDKINVSCPEKANLVSNCYKDRKDNRKDSGHFKMKLKNLPQTNLCSIMCTLTYENKTLCSANLTLHVLKMNVTDTQNEPDSPEFPVAVLVSVLTALLVTTSLAFRFYKALSRWRTTFQSKQQTTSFRPSNGSSHPRDEDCEAVMISSTSILHKHENNWEKDGCGSDHLYYEIKDTTECHDNTATKVSLHEQDNLLTTETSDSHDISVIIHASTVVEVFPNESQKFSELHIKPTNVERKNEENECGPIKKGSYTAGNLTNNDENELNKVEVFYAVLENDQD